MCLNDAKTTLYKTACQILFANYEFKSVITHFENPLAIVNWFFTSQNVPTQIIILKYYSCLNRFLVRNKY